MLPSWWVDLIHQHTPHYSYAVLQTDGASAALLMSEEKALALGYTPKAYVRCEQTLCCHVHVTSQLSMYICMSER